MCIYAFTCGNCLGDRYTYNDDDDEDDWGDERLKGMGEREVIKRGEGSGCWELGLRI